MFKFLSTFCIMLVVSLIHSASVHSQSEVRIQALDWSPDGTQIVTGNNIGDVEIWDVASGTLAHTLHGHTQEIMTLKWSPDGTRVASGSSDGTVRIWDVMSGEAAQIIQFSLPTGGQRAILDIDWSADSTLIAGARDTGSIIIWDALTGEQRATYSHDSMALTVAWSPSDTILASGGSDGKLLLWDANSQSLSEFAAVSSATSSSIYSIAWSPEGEKIAIGSGFPGVQVDVEVFNFSTQELLVQIPRVSDGFVSLRWSPVNTELAISDADAITIVNTSTGVIDERFSGGGILDALAWSPYGGQLAVRNNASQSATRSTRLGSVVQIVVPVPSPERLQAIADACNAPAAVEQSLTASIQADQLSNVIAQVEALPEDTIPPACAADLIAVAQALQNQ